MGKKYWSQQAKDLTKTPTWAHYESVTRDRILGSTYYHHVARRAAHLQPQEDNPV